MDFDMLSRKKVYFCRRLRHKKELYALVSSKQNLAKFYTQWERSCKVRALGVDFQRSFVCGFARTLVYIGCKKGYAFLFAPKQTKQWIIKHW